MSEKIEFKKVNFGFEKEKTLIKNLNFNIEKNSIFGIFGKTGSGKSTILDLIIGLYAPQEGEILIDNKEIKNIKKEEWLTNIAYVGQNNFIFDNNILSNITYEFSNEKDKDKKINHFEFNKDLLEKAINYSCVKEFIGNTDSLKNNINIGEKGNQLSGGQLQRIAIARAIYSNRPVLIFDEISSALDESTEIKIFENLLKLKSENKTIIISSHSKNLERYCDKMLNLDEKNF